MELTVEIFHKSNWANETVRAARRSKFLCALVLALRKIPIYAPGGGGAALGSADQPSYTVAVSDQQAVDARAAYDKAKDAKRLIPNKKDDEAGEKTDNQGASTASDPRDSATPPPLRYRQGCKTEDNVVQDLNSRHPAADTAKHPKDYVEPPTPKTITRPVSGATEGTDILKDSKIDEVRVMLSRGSSMGKRRRSLSLHDPITNQDRPPRIENGEKSDYDPYSYYSQQPSSTTTRGDHTDDSSRRNHAGQEREPNWPQPPSNSFRPPPTISEQHSYHSPPPPAATSTRPEMDPRRPPPPPQTPAPPPKDASRATNPTYTNITPPAPSLANHPYHQQQQRPFVGNDPASARDPSPVRNPFQINALRSQAQGAGVPRAARPDSNVSALSGPPPPGYPPQTRRPVGAGMQGNGGPPRGQSQERPPQGMTVRPARSDSLGGSRKPEHERVIWHE